MKSIRTLEQPVGYHVIEGSDSCVLCRPDGEELWRFDPAAVLEWEIVLAALEDHSSELLSS